MMETVFSKWIGELPQRNYNFTREGIMKACGVSRQTFTNWQKGTQQPSEQNNIRIAYFAFKHSLPAYMSETITPIEIKRDDTGGQWIHAQQVVNENLKEERYVVYFE